MRTFTAKAATVSMAGVQAWAGASPGLGQLGWRLREDELAAVFRRGMRASIADWRSGATHGEK